MKSPEPIYRRATAVIVSALVLLVAACDSSEPGATTVAPTQPEETIGRSGEDQPDLADGTLREVVAAMERGEVPDDEVGRVGDLIRVEVHHQLEPEEAANLVSDFGGEIEGESAGVVQALVPYDRLEELEATDGINFLRPPAPVNIPQG